MPTGTAARFGAGALVSLVFLSCIVKESKDTTSDGEGGSAATGGSIVNLNGGAANNANAGGTGATGNRTSTGETAKPCEGLLEQLQTDPAQVCSQNQQEARFNKINVLIVLDKSGSMSSTPEGYTKTKWSSAIDALRKSLQPTSELVSYGIALYPYSASVATPSCELDAGDAAINIKVGPAVDTVPEILGLLESTSPGGGTPTAAALGAAFEYFTNGSGLGLEGAKYVLLVTDGGPNCNAAISCSVETCTAFMDKAPSMSSCWNGGVANCCSPAAQVPGGSDPRALCLDDVAVTAQLDSLKSAGINTFVIGIPGSESYAQYLDTFAQSGGKPVLGKARKYYEVAGESDLADAFESITTKLVDSCVVPLDAPPIDRNLFNVAINCTPIPEKTGDQTNWIYDDASQSIVIEGPKCQQIKTVGVERIDVVNGCPPVKVW
jgi:hypothetical protein